MKTITKVLLVLLVAGAVTVASILANGVSDVGLANDAPTLESQPGPYLSVKEALPPLESQPGPFLSAKEVLPALESQPGPDSVLPGPLPQSPSVLECFLTFSTGEPQNKSVWLWTQNFGDDFVRVNGTTILMCEGAVKTGPDGTVGSLDPPVVFACYLMSDGRISNDPYQLVTRNFGPDDVRVLDAVAMCESARKTHPDGKTFGHPGGHVLELFTISGGLNPDTDVVLETNNFGRHRAHIGEAIALMEEAKKTPPAGEPPTGDGTGRVWECFVEEAPLLQDFAQVKLETANFAPEEVFVHVQPVVMCEEANKIKRFPTGTSIFGLAP